MVMTTTDPITLFNVATIVSIAAMLQAQHSRTAQLDRPASERSLTARNYDSAIAALGEYLEAIGEPLPSKSVLERWRDDMLAGRTGRPYAVRTVNARLSAARKLLRGVADDVTDLGIKLVLNDWAKVNDAKATAVQDKIEGDYGRRLTLDSLQTLLQQPDVSTLKGLRDRALMALMAGAGLRVSEVANLTLPDVFDTVNEHGQRGIRVVRGKHNKSRIVVLNGWNSWVLRAVQPFVDALALTPHDVIFRGLKREKNGGYSPTGSSLTTRGIERAVNAYMAEYLGEMTVINCHDLRRTYARLCHQSGMAWEALRANMGHSSITVTEKYVGQDVDWSERVPNWTIQL